ncbi:hypothetical protein F2Q69_00049559 [Brassica cretica]|uniref:Uncharacterized protein n=1 Tax=Brassica cretica TaxID=69181 RepID=A0A8S9Q9D1_BRACR|nr:hypothetical protein F2Q69_00049559 [Brassica cretica]
MKQENGQREFGQELTEVVLSRHQQKRLAYASGAPLEEDLHQQNRAISDNLYSQSNIEPWLFITDVTYLNRRSDAPDRLYLHAVYVFGGIVSG